MYGHGGSDIMLRIFHELSDLNIKKIKVYLVSIIEVRMTEPGGLKLDLFWSYHFYHHRRLHTVDFSAIEESFPTFIFQLIEDAMNKMEIKKTYKYNT